MFALLSAGQKLWKPDSDGGATTARRSDVEAPPDGTSSAILYLLTLMWSANFPTDGKNTRLYAELIGGSAAALLQDHISTAGPDTFRPLNGDWGQPTEQAKGKWRAGHSTADYPGLVGGLLGVVFLVHLFLAREPPATKQCRTVEG